MDVTKSTELDLQFSFNAMCEVERITGKTTSQIVEELQSEEGAGFHVLRTLVAAGFLWKNPWVFKTGMVEGFIDEAHAGDLIQRIGIAETAAHVGERLGLYLKTLGSAA